MIAITPAEAPTIDRRLIGAANAYVVAGGGIAIIGRPAPWGEVSPTHQERFTPHAFLNRVPPPLLAAHTSQSNEGGEIIADGLAADSSRYGFDAVWGLKDNLYAVDHLFGHLADGISGLSVEMVIKLGRRTFTWAEGHLHQVDQATMRAVAVVDAPSYPSARIMHVVTPDALWSYDPAAERLMRAHRGDAIPAERVRELASDRARDRIADALLAGRDTASAIRSAPSPDDAGPIETTTIPLAGFTFS